MKRRITLEQLQELTDEQRKKLREWWKPQEGDWYEIHIKTPGGELKEARNANWQIKYEKINSDYTPLLDVGQMIELLQDAPYVRYSFQDKNIIKVYRDMEMKSWHIKILENDLCDILWKAVKTVL